jgi:opacity protein-like surface antigen
MPSVKYFLAAAGAATLLSSAALAADMPSIAPPPQYNAPVVEDFGGWYLRGDIGLSNASLQKRDWYTYPTLLSLSQDNGFDAAGIYGIGVGYQFNSWFRADVIGQYRGKANFHGTDLFTFSNGGGVARGVDTYTASLSEWLVLANGYVDLGTWWHVTPFVGAGVGFSRNTISHFVDTNVPTLGVASASAGSVWNFAWALHTGLAYRVSSGLTVELGYSYVNLGEAASGIVAAYNAAPLGNTMKFRDITSQDLKLGVRWNLESPQEYAPPLIRKG